MRNIIKLVVLVILIIIKQVECIYNMSIYQDLTYQFSNSITTINFIKNTDFFYVLTQEQNLLNYTSITQINQLQINDTYTNNSNFEIFQLINPQANQSLSFVETEKNQTYEQIIQINSDYFLMYTKNKPYYQIFSLNGSIFYYNLQQNNSQFNNNQQFINQTCVISKIQFSIFLGKVLIFYSNGILQIVQFNNYLISDDISSQILNVSFSGEIDAALSPNQNLLVVYLKQTGQISLYQINQNLTQNNSTLIPIFQNLTLYQIDLVLWDEKSMNLYMYNQQNSSFYQVELAYSISTMKYTYKVWIYSLNLNSTSKTVQKSFATKYATGYNSTTQNVTYTYSESKINHKLMYYPQTDQIMLVRFTLSELNFTNITTYINTTQNITSNQTTNATGTNATLLENWLQRYLMVQFLTYDFYNPFFTSRLIHDMSKVFFNLSDNISIVQNGQLDVQFDSGGYLYVFGWNKQFGKLFVDVGGIMFFTNITYNGTGGNYTKTRIRNQATFPNYVTNTTQNSPNSTNLNQTNNTQKNQTTYIKQKSQAQQNYQGIVDSLMDNSFINAFNKLPGSRKYFRPIFMYFGNFDDLWLYYYDERDYGPIVNYIFEKIRHLQTQKWQTVNIQTLWQSITPFDIQAVQNYFNSTSKLKFTSSKYLLIQNKSTGYIENTLSFYFSNLLFIVITFFVGKMIFTMAVYFDLKIRTFFHKFKFGYYLLIMSLDGNIQFMSFLFGFQLKSMVKESKYEIFQLSFVVFHNFFFIFAVMGMYFFIQKNYKHSSLKLYQNFANLKYTCLYFTVQYGLRNIILGMVHIMLSQQIYITKISILIAIQFSFLFFNIYLVQKKKIFTQKIRVWLSSFTTFVRIIFISLFLPTFDENMELFLQNLFIFIVYLYMSLWVVSMINQFLIIIIEIYQFLKLVFQSNQKLKLRSMKSLKNNNQQHFIQQPNKSDVNLQFYYTNMNESLNMNKKTNKNLSKPQIYRQSLLDNPNFNLKSRNFRQIKKILSDRDETNLRGLNQKESQNINESINEEQGQIQEISFASVDINENIQLNITNNAFLDLGFSSKAKLNKLSSFGSNKLKASRFNPINKNQNHLMSLQPQSKIEQIQDVISQISSERKDQHLQSEDNSSSPKNSPQVESEQLPSQKTYEPTNQQLQAFSQLINNRKILYRTSDNLRRNKNSSIINRKESFRPSYRQSITHNTEQFQEIQNIQPSINSNVDDSIDESRLIKAKVKHKKRVSKSMSIIVVNKQHENLSQQNDNLDINNQKRQILTIQDL